MGHNSNGGNDGPALIRASELAEFGFCERAWWLSNVQQVARQHQQHLERGQAVHIRHEQQVEAASRWSKISLGLFVSGGLLFLMAIASALVA